MRREQMLDNVASQVGQGQRTHAETSLRISQLERNLSVANGKIEELEHDNKQNTQGEIATLKKEISALQKDLEDRDNTLKEIQNTLEEQKKYLKEVLDTLATLNEAGAQKKKSKKKDELDEEKNNKSPYELAIQYYHDGKYQEAKPALVELLKNKKINGNNRAKIIHSLGMINYLEENFDDSITYFGRLFSEHPGSSLNSGGLLHLGLSLKHQKKKQEAKLALEECLRRYPKSKSATQAKELLQKL